MLAASNFGRRLGPPDQSQRRHLPGRLAAITCYFNPCAYRALQRNYRRFAEALAEQEVPLFTAELAFHGHSFFLPAGPRVLQLRSNSVLWHKERLLNLLLPRISDEYDKVAWVDADLLFTNPQWAQETSRLLEEYPVVQLFEEAVQLDADEQPAAAPSPGIAWGMARQLPRAWDIGRFRTGFAWAARRELLMRHGFLDNNVVGGGDASMVVSMYGWWDHIHLRCFPPAVRAGMAQWAYPFWEDVRGRVSYVPGRVLHLWHGSRTNRQYAERLRWLFRYQFDPARDLFPDPLGVWQWTGRNAALEQEIRQYFFDRREDE